MEDTSAPTDWCVSASAASLRTTNPIRQIVDKLDLKKINADLELIRLSIGDPTVYGNLPLPESAVAAVKSVLDGAKHNGYSPSTGNVDARRAIAEAHSTPESPLSADDVLITSGCSHAIDMCLSVLGEPGRNVLLPKPGFSLYQTLCEFKGVGVRHYALLPNAQWEIDLAHLESLIDGNTCAIVVNNPSNPCGSNYSKQHLLDILAIAERHKLPILADEIYAKMTFADEFHSMATLSAEVPILVCGGLAKRYMMPGWRIGWICVHDRKNRFAQVREGLNRVSQTILGANSVAQGAIRSILHDTLPSYYANVITKLSQSATFFTQKVSQVHGLTPITPQAAMYVMVRIETDVLAFDDDVSFCQALLQEQSVFVLPGQCFGMPCFFRVVFCAPVELLREACDRIAAFCDAHHR